MPMIRHPLAVSQNYNSDKETAMTFKNAYSITDKLKCEIFEGLPEDGVAIINLDNRLWIIG